MLPEMLERLAHLIVRRRRVVIGIWIALTLFGAYSAGAVSKRWYQSFSIPGYSGYEANQRALARFGSGEQPPFVAVFHSAGDITSQAGIARKLTIAELLRTDPLLPRLRRVGTSNSDGNARPCGPSWCKAH